MLHDLGEGKGKQEIHTPIRPPFGKLRRCGEDRTERGAEAEGVGAGTVWAMSLRVSRERGRSLGWTHYV